MASKVTLTTVVTPGKVSIRQLYDAVTVKPDYVRVGLPDTPHEGAKLTIAQIGAIHEYGAPAANIPQRPFLHPALREGAPQLERLSKALLFQVQNNQITKEYALERLGLLGQGLVQKKIRHGDFVELKPATIAARKKKFGRASTAPLRASGQMMQSVTFAVEK
jgi:hypothetical protein